MARKAQGMKSLPDGFLYIFLGRGRSVAIVTMGMEVEEEILHKNVLIEFIVCLCKKSFIVIDGHLALPTLALRASFMVIDCYLWSFCLTFPSPNGRWKVNLEKTFHRPMTERNPYDHRASVWMDEGGHKNV